MANQSEGIPSDIALAQLKEKVAQDKNLPVAIRQAFLCDLNSPDPDSLKKLKATLTVKA